MQEPTNITDTSIPTEAKIEVTVETGGAITSPSTNAQFEEIKEKVVVVLSELPGYISRFFGSYQKPIITIVLILSALVTLKVLFAVIDALNDVPLLAPTFELIGMGYTAWFVYRYLLKASTRQELVQEFKSYKEQVTGD
ncbi:MAG: CAAD domain-containing protein [Planktothrix sp.]